MSTNTYTSVMAAAAKINRTLDSAKSKCNGNGTEILDFVHEIAAAIEDSCNACREADRDLAQEQLTKARHEFRNAIRERFTESWFMARATSKPRGYPGDFEMLEGIYDRGPRSKTSLGQMLDQYFLQTPLARGVVGRKNFIRDRLIKLIREANGRQVTVLDIAAGPCRELVESIELRSCANLTMTLIDRDSNALDYVRANLANNSCRADVRLRPYDVLRMISANRNMAEFEKYDLIYSVGLFDYLPDDAVIRIVRATMPLLRPDGSLVVAFKDADRYSATEYQWHVDWHFLQRYQADCAKLMSDAGAGIVDVKRDDSGIMLFFELRP